MNFIQSESSRMKIREETLDPGAPEKRSSEEQEKKADMIAGQILGKEDIRTKVFEARTKRRSLISAGSRRSRPFKISQAIQVVKSKKATPSSFHNKWPSPTFKTILEDRGIDIIERISSIRANLSRTKEAYRSILADSPPSQMQEEVMELLRTGKVIPSEGGKGGVYFIQDASGNSKFVIKPGDESNLALNNCKQFASPFFDGEEANPVSMNIYDSVQNAELAYFAAKLFGLQEITPMTEVMIIEHPAFHDLLDDTIEKDDPCFQKMEEITPATREKVCSVQVFMDQCWDIGSLLCSYSNLQPEEIKQLSADKPVEFEEFNKQYMPPDFDHENYEKIAIFSFIIGENDGNAGNLICSKELFPGESSRHIYKIDNADSFPEHNNAFRSGLNWVPQNYTNPFSSKAKEFIENLDNNAMEKLEFRMRKLGKSEASIEAMKDRFVILKTFGPHSDSVADLEAQLLG